MRKKEKETGPIKKWDPDEVGFFIAALDDKTQGQYFQSSGRSLYSNWSCIPSSIIEAK